MRYKIRKRCNKLNVRLSAGARQQHLVSNSGRGPPDAALTRFRLLLQTMDPCVEPFGAPHQRLRSLLLFLRMGGESAQPSLRLGVDGTSRSVWKGVDRISCWLSSGDRWNSQYPAAIAER